ncbi:MAG: tetratricopeptide repeat protein, partial [Bacteroidales bacterium]|nr:tetratricopeptide repeat protein [Bacteroidales bacterium]
MSLRYVITLIISTHVFLASFGQTQQDVNNLYRDANAYFYFEDYEEALALYLNIYENFPDNQNIDYRIGICYLNISNQKTKAIPYLERAVENTSHRYNESSIKETSAPLEAYFYLGNAYYVANRLKEAKSAYDSFKSNLKNERKYNIDYLNHQLEGLERAKMLKNYSVNLLRSNLGETINNRLPNFNPVISGDGKTMAFTTEEKFYQSINISKKVNGKWEKPTNITLDLMVDGNCSTLSLNYNATELYLFKDDNHDGNIYVSNFSDGKWSPMRKLNENINTESYETHASVSSDGSKLYFASNREGGFGDLDIYVSHKDEMGNWGPAVNLGENINTQFNENTPFITNDGKTLFFSSDGHNTMGGYDIFFSQLNENGSWSTPINLGYPINTTDDELFYQPIDDGAMGLMALFDPKGFGQTDIVQIEIFLPRYKRSIVPSSDFYARKSSLPHKTLIIDTVNVSGVALLDPSRHEHIEYLSNKSRHTLFFEGKPYELQDQSKVNELLVADTDKVIDDDELNSIEPITINENNQNIKEPIDTSTKIIKPDTTLTKNMVEHITEASPERLVAETTTVQTIPPKNDIEQLHPSSEFFEIISA